MLWLRKFHPPRLTPQVCATMKLCFYLPNYQIHRLFQLESQTNLSTIPSLKHFRDRVRKVTTLFDSMKETHSIIDVMMDEGGSPTVLTPQDIITPRTSRRLLHPPTIREKGVTDITTCHGPTTGSTPQRYLHQYYQNESNISSQVIIDRKRTCQGNPILLVDQDGKKRKMNCFRCGGRSMLVYCTI